MKRSIFTWFQFVKFNIHQLLNSLIPPHAFEMENINNIGNCGGDVKFPFSTLFTNLINSRKNFHFKFNHSNRQQVINLIFPYRNPEGAVASGMRRLIGASLLRECPE
ncbi:hypothetical protein T08_14611 [Trichinella sp. T8]|nr:hypothetical protein T08_14611 [Trichinella sp. T8]